MSAFRDPVFGGTYGVSKTGKTTDTLYSFPGAFYLAPPGALKPSVHVVGFDVPEAHCYDPKSVPDAVKKLKEIANKRCPHCGHVFTQAVVDDFSLLCELSFALLETARGLSGWKLWGALADEVLDFRDTGRRLGIHVFVNMHERAPAIVSGVSQRGGPKLPGKLPESFPAACDIILRAAAGAAGGVIGGVGKTGWGNVYRCNPMDASWVTGDRHGVTTDNAPMNLAEILRAAGYDVARAPGLEWMDAAVEMLAGVFANGGAGSDATNLQQAGPWLLQQMVAMPAYVPLTATLAGQRLIGLHARWVIRDAYDRAILLRARMNPLAMFGVTI
mgnify:CR=1 FL=1